MNSYDTLIAFASAVLLLAVVFAWVFRATFGSLIDQAAQHSKTYATAYVKAGCLILITMGNTFKETFQPLTTEMVRSFAWWDWVIKLGAPILAGLAVMVAFLDRSMERADASKTAKPLAVAKPDDSAKPTP